MNRSYKTSRPLQNLHISFDEEDVRAVTGAFWQGSFSGKSPVVSEYESVIASYFGVPHAMACSNGTAAIELVLRGLDLKPGDRVGVPPTAPVMTILPVIALGCEPVFYDVAPDSFAPDLTDLAHLARMGLHALITVPMWGYPWDMVPVVEFCTAHGIKLVEDCAHAFGTEMAGRKFGTFGDAATFSTHERKLVSTGEGGFCLVRDREVFDRMRSWQQHGATFDSSGNYRLGEGLGGNYKLPPLCAALGISQFAKLDQKIAARRRTAELVRAVVKDCAVLVEFDRYPEAEINGYALVYWCLDERLAGSGGAELARRGIQSDTVRYAYKPLYREPAFAAHARPCPNAERMIASIITLPCHEGLTKTDVHELGDVVADVYGPSLQRASAA